MKKVFLFSSFLAAILLFMPVHANAEIRAGAVEVTPFVGKMFFDEEANLKNQVVYGLREGYNFTKNIGIEGSIEFVHASVDDLTKPEGGNPSFGAPASAVTSYLYHIDGIYHFLPDGDFNPFVTAGAGVAIYHPNVNSTNGRFLTDVGAGAKYWFSDRAALRVEVRDIITFDRTLNNIEVTGGIGFALGGSR
jgi:OOP family OmpA-OmpF porin